MKVKKISCEQFAGLLDREIELTDGINVIFGQNESGKSTLVNLLSRTLFQSYKMKMSTIEGKKFKAHYFPVPVKGADTLPDYVDGSITLETDDGEYTISRTWGVGAQEKLKTPSGNIKDADTIQEILRQQLTYGEGVYRDILLTSQYEAAHSLEQLLQSSGAEEAKKELLLSASSAFAESDGITMEAIEAAIQEKISEIQGERWDVTQNIPVRNKQNKRWDKKKGTILSAYYGREDAQNTLARLHELEASLDHANASLREADRLLEEAIRNRDSFQEFSGLLEKRAELRKNVLLLQESLKDCQAAEEQWPKNQEAFIKGSALKLQLQQRELLDLYNGAQRMRGQLLPLEASLEGQSCPQDTEISAVKQADRRITKLQNQLCSMNLAAQLTMLDSHAMEITSLRTGEQLDIGSGAFPITEAVLLRIPGVMELQLAPADVDVTGIEQEIRRETLRRQEILDRFQVTSADDLDLLAQHIRNRQQEAATLSDKLHQLLGEYTFEELEAEVQKLPTEIPDTAALRQQIRELCQSQNLDTFLGACQSKLTGYKNQYGSPDALSEKMSSMQAELQGKEDALDSLQEIPQEYHSITDPQAYLKQLSVQVMNFTEKKGESADAKSRADQALESYQNTISGDPYENLDLACQEFEVQKESLAHWLHIQQIFQQQKELVQDNPAQDIADHFAKYLSLISDGTVSTEFPEFGKLQMDIYSKDRSLTYATLSEGTKETVSLAFRLAVLDHLFPEGGGILVLDDPFTDMDAQRTAQSCSLIRDCAQRHQILVMTCREEYCSLLGGNRINI